MNQFHYYTIVQHWRNDEADPFAWNRGFISLGHAKAAVEAHESELYSLYGDDDTEQWGGLVWTDEDSGLWNATDERTGNLYYQVQFVTIEGVFP